MYYIILVIKIAIQHYRTYDFIKQYKHDQT